MSRDMAEETPLAANGDRNSRQPQLHALAVHYIHYLKFILKY